MYYSGPLTNTTNTWRIITTPYKITKAIIYFRQYDGAAAERKTLQALHSFKSSGRMSRVSLDLNGNRIPFNPGVDVSQHPARDW